MAEDLPELTPEQRALLILRLRKKAASAAEQQGAEAPPIVPVSRGRNLPLSFAQQRLWFLDQLEPNNSFYNIPLAVRLRGALDTAALERGFSELVRRHESLRTTFVVDEGEPAQVIAPPARFSLEVQDLSASAHEQREEQARRLAAEEAGTPFDLSRGPLLRVRLLRLGEEEHVLLLTMHHIISDGWSMGVLIREVATLYEAYAHGEESPLEELPIQYADFAVWQREWLSGEVLEKQLNYWRGQLAGAPPVLELPTDKPRPEAQSYEGAIELLEFSEELSERLRETARREGVTLFMLLLAAFQVLLSHYSGQEDVVVGAPVANRNHIETESLIGFFINMLVLRTSLKGDPTFRELLHRVRDTTVGAYAHQEVPFEKLVEKLQPERGAMQTPWVQVAVDFESVKVATVKLPSLTLEPFGGDGIMAAKFDLVLSIQGMQQRLGASMTYNTDLYSAPRIKAMLKHLELALTAVPARPEIRVGELKQLVAETERQQRLAEQDEFKKTRLKMLKGVKPKAIRSSLNQS